MAAAVDGDRIPTAFKLDVINFNERTWGPTNTRECLDSCLYERLGKPAFDPVHSRGGHDNKFGLIKSCDFTFQSQLRAQKDGRLAPGMAWQEDEMQFTHVDSRPLKTSKKPYYYKKPQKLSTAAYQQKQQEEKAETKGKKAQMKPATHRGRHMWHNRFQNRQPRQTNEWSVEISSEWQSVAELPIAQLLKMSVDGHKVQYKDKCWQGTICVFDPSFTKIAASDPVPLKPARQALVHPSLQDDQVIASDLQDEKSPAQVAAADFVIATLMAAGQSKYSWHISVYKEGDTLIFDKPEQNSNCENLTVNETGYDVPLHEDPVIINRPPELSREAMKVNRYFGVQCLRGALQPLKTFEPPSFWEDVEAPAPKGYRYRYITLPGKERIQEGTSERQKEPIIILTRGEVDAVVVGTVEPGKSLWDAATPVSLKALNEYAVAGKKPWKSQLTSNLKGSLLVAEIRSNSAKMAKWVAQAMISGCEHIKLGYVSRRDNSSNAAHDILSVQSYLTHQLATTMSFKLDNAWGIVRGLVDLLRDQKDGNYVIVRDPSRAFINVYYVPDSPEDNPVADLH